MQLGVLGGQRLEPSPPLFGRQRLQFMEQRFEALESVGIGHGGSASLRLAQLWTLLSTDENPRRQPSRRSSRHGDGWSRFGRYSGCAGSPEAFTRITSSRSPSIWRTAV